MGKYNSKIACQGKSQEYLRYHTANIVNKGGGGHWNITIAGVKIKRTGYLKIRSFLNSVLKFWNDTDTL